MEYYVYLDLIMGLLVFWFIINPLLPSKQKWLILFTFLVYSSIFIGNYSLGYTVIVQHIPIHFVIISISVLFFINLFTYTKIQESIENDKLDTRRKLAEILYSLFTFLEKPQCEELVKSIIYHLYITRESMPTRLVFSKNEELDQYCFEFDRKFGP